MTCSRIVQWLMMTCSCLFPDFFMTCSWLVLDLFIMTCSWHVDRLILFTMTNLSHVHDICFFIMACSWHVHDLFLILFMMTCSWLVCVMFIMWWHHSVIASFDPALGPASETSRRVARGTLAWTTHASRASLTTTHMWWAGCWHFTHRFCILVATTHVPLVTSIGVIRPLLLLRAMAFDNKDVRVLIWCSWGCHRSVALVCQGLMLVRSSLGISWHLLLLDMMAQHVLTWHGHESACILASLHCVLRCPVCLHWAKDFGYTWGVFSELGPQPA